MHAGTHRLCISNIDLDYINNMPEWLETHKNVTISRRVHAIIMYKNITFEVTA
jgi:hypothetical protein